MCQSYRIDQRRRYSPCRSFSPGRSTSNRRGRRRRTASSRSNGLFVAPITMTLSSLEDLRPSISCMNSVMTPRWANALPLSRADIRAPNRASISSRNTTQGDNRRAREKTALTSFSPSPTYYHIERSKNEDKEDDNYIYHVHDVGGRDRKHTTPCLFCECTYYQCFSGSRRTKEKAAGHAVFLQNSVLKCMGVEQRQGDNRANSINSLRGKMNLTKGSVNGD